VFVRIDIAAGSASHQASDERQERRLIFSRKGFDSVFGGRPSPVLPDGRMVSLPIPEPGSPITYGDCLVEHGVSFADLLTTMGAVLIRDRRSASAQRLEVRPDLGAHLDPDLREDARPSRPAGWRPLFGQSDIAARHLATMGVGPGDIFVFFGWFAHTEYHSGLLRYERRVPRFQGVWGWMEISEAAPGEEFAARHPWAVGQHPHLIPALTGNYSPNVVYMGAQRSAVVPGAPGTAVMRYSPKARLTRPAGTPRWWSLPEAFHPRNTAWPMTYHPPGCWSEPHYGQVTLRSASIGQEFIVPINDGIRAWLADLISPAATW
jgi:hypothetical protein